MDDTEQHVWEPTVLGNIMELDTIRRPHQNECLTVYDLHTWDNGEVLVRYVGGGEFYGHADDLIELLQK